MALSPSSSPMRKKKLRGNLLSIQNSKVCYDRTKQIAFNDEEDATIMVAWPSIQQRRDHGILTLDC
jgi:hypothetical protein